MRLTDLRTVARACLDAAIEAADPHRLVVEALEDEGAAGPLAAGPVVLLAVGKAALGMASGACAVLGEQVRRGLIVVPNGSGMELPRSGGGRIDLLVAGHPLPDARSVRAAMRVHDLARGASGEERFLVLLSGGASALLSLPAAGLTLEEVQATSDLLLKAGASIDELNTVRKQLDALKGGGLAAATAPAPVTGLVISDVVGDRLDVIASGPLVYDPTTLEDAVEVLRRRGLWRDAPRAVRRYLLAGPGGGGERSPCRDDARWRQVEVRVVGNNRLAAEAAMKEAARRGFEPRLLTTSLEGEARDAGRRLALLALEVRRHRRPIVPPACLVAGGETVVTVRGKGKGGRSQELALAAATELRGHGEVLLAAFGSDGIDGPTDAAGAWVDGTTVERGRVLGLDESAALEENDAYTYFATLDDLIVTGPTGTNVMDLVLLFIG